MNATLDQFERIEMPDGGLLELGRPRFAGILSEAERAYCRAHGVPVGWDPVQDGWVALGAPDELAPASRAQPAPQLAPKLRLRPWRDEDAPRLARLLNDPQVWDFLPEDWPGEMTEDMAADLIAIARAAQHQQVQAIEADGVPVGQMRLLRGRGAAGPGEAEIGYWLGRAHWGRGLASAAVAMATRSALSGPEAPRALVARVHEANRASARVLEKCGFTPAGPDPDMPGWTRYRRDTAQA
jgi:RimJ/RimL family protein N-acetyltransferase